MPTQQQRKAIVMAAAAATINASTVSAVASIHSQNQVRKLKLIYRKRRVIPLYHECLWYKVYHYGDEREFIHLVGLTKSSLTNL